MSSPKVTGDPFSQAECLRTVLMGSFVHVVHFAPAGDYLTCEWLIAFHNVLASKEPIRMVRLVHLAENGLVVLHFSASLLDSKTPR